METIVKRDGRVVSFDAGKIGRAMKKAIDATNTEVTGADLFRLEFEAVSRLEKLGTLRDKVTVEDAQDAAEKVLMANGYYDAAKAFILYREAHKRVRGISSEVKKFSEGLVSDAMGSFDVTESADPCKEMDVIKNQNASTPSGTLGSSILAESEAITKMWWESLYDPEIRRMSQVDGGDGEIYIHDMGVAAGYCAGWSLKDVLMKGISGVKNKMSSKPAKHLSTLCNQLVNFLGITQNEWAGAQAVSSFDTYLAPFVKVDNLPFDQVKQCIQSFVFGVNTPSRWGCQAPFTNVTLDWTVPDDMAVLPAIVGGKEMDFTYGDCQKEMDTINKAFLEVMLDGDADGRGPQYPIPTYSITKDFDWSDTENNRLLFEYAAKYGGPYFSNYVNSDMSPRDVRSMCCRLRLNLRELRKQNGGNFGAGENTGSIGVVTINLPHIAYLAPNEKAFFNELEHAMNVAARSLDIKRKVVTKYLERENSAYPYTKAYLTAGFKNHFSTIGIVGMNEACLNAKWLKKDLFNDECIAWANKVLDFMREKLSDYQEQYGCLFNLEATPAESTMYTLARIDRRRYPDIICGGTKNGETPYYTNSSHLPVGATDDIFEALDKEDEMQTKYTSGTVFHAFLGERLPDWKSAMKLVKTIAENYRLPYFTLSPTYSICEDHGYIPGEVKACPVCGKPTEIYSRITGYYRPVSNWNAGKAQEFVDRREYDVTGLTDSVRHGKFTSSGKEELVSPASADSCEIHPARSIVVLSTKTCPKCAMIKKKMDALGISYKNVFAEDPEGQDIAIRYGISAVPVMFVTENGRTDVIRDFPEIVKTIAR